MTPLLHLFDSPILCDYDQGAWEIEFPITSTVRVYLQNLVAGPAANEAESGVGPTLGIRQSSRFSANA